MNQIIYFRVKWATSTPDYLDFHATKEKMKKKKKYLNTLVAYRRIKRWFCIF